MKVINRCTNKEKPTFLSETSLILLKSNPFAFLIFSGGILSIFSFLSCLQVLRFIFSGDENAEEEVLFLASIVLDCLSIVSTNSAGRVCDHGIISREG